MRVPCKTSTVDIRTHGNHSVVWQPLDSPSFQRKPGVPKKTGPNWFAPCPTNSWLKLIFGELHDPPWDLLDDQKSPATEMQVSNPERLYALWRGLAMGIEELLILEPGCLFSHDMPQFCVASHLLSSNSWSNAMALTRQCGSIAAMRI